MRNTNRLMELFLDGGSSYSGGSATSRGCSECFQAGVGLGQRSDGWNVDFRNSRTALGFGYGVRNVQYVPDVQTSGLPYNQPCRIYRVRSVAAFRNPGSVQLSFGPFDPADAYEDTGHRRERTLRDHSTGVGGA